jgi:hypothetical protein
MVSPTNAMFGNIFRTNLQQPAELLCFSTLLSFNNSIPAGLLQPTPVEEEVAALRGGFFKQGALRPLHQEPDQCAS